MFIILIVAFFQTFSAEGQSTSGSCEANGLYLVDEIQNTILDEIRYLQNRERCCSSSCPQIEELLERHLSNMTQTLQSFNNRLGKYRRFQDYFVNIFSLLYKRSIGQLMLHTLKVDYYK